MLRKIDTRLIQRNDLGKDTPSWSEGIIDAVNKTTEFLIDAFKGNISVKNLNIQTLNFTIEAPFIQTRFAKERPDRIYAVSIAQILTTSGGVVGALTGIDWFEDGNSIVVTNVFGLTSGVRYQCKLMVQYF